MKVMQYYLNGYLHKHAMILSGSMAATSFGLSFVLSSLIMRLCCENGSWKMKIRYGYLKILFAIRRQMVTEKQD